MEIKTLTKKELSDYSNLAKKIILNTNYYTEHAKREESEKFSEESLEKKIKDRNNLFVFAEEDKKLIAFFNGQYDSGTFWANWLGVDPTYRNKGITEKILFYVNCELERNNVHKVWFDTLVNNKEAVGLVKKLGFKKIGRLNNHWHNQDFYLWEKEL